MQTRFESELNVIRPERALDLLEQLGVRSWLSGVWAEELRGLIQPRPHADIDLLYPACSFDTLDRPLSDGTLQEITRKHFHHKRAFDLDGVMVEVVLLEPAERGYVTNFWNVLQLEWPEQSLEEIDGVRLASEAALTAYREWHSRVDVVRRRVLGVVE